MMEKRDNLLPPPPPPPPVVAKNESLTSPEMLPTQRKKKKKNKRRFSDEQVKLMESMFESDTKLEPKKKVQVARELGLQPRQVAIWFQNRRARWKSKQIEKDYRILKANYDNLTLRFESLKKEKDSLLIQLQKLNGLIEQSHDKSKDIKGLVENSTDGGSDNGDANCEYEVNPGCLEEGLHHRVVMDFNNHDDQSRYMGCTGQEQGPKFLNTDDYVDSSLAPPFGLLDQSCIVDSHWFNFWT